MWCIACLRSCVRLLSLKRDTQHNRPCAICETWRASSAATWKSCVRLPQWFRFVIDFDLLFFFLSFFQDLGCVFAFAVQCVLSDFNYVLLSTLKRFNRIFKIICIQITSSVFFYSIQSSSFDKIIIIIIKLSNRCCAQVEELVTTLVVAKNGGKQPSPQQMAQMVQNIQSLSSPNVTPAAMQANLPAARAAVAEAAAAAAAAERAAGQSPLDSVFVLLCLFDFVCLILFACFCLFDFVCLILFV